MLMNYHICRLVLSSLCVGDFVEAGIWWCSFCRLQPVNISFCLVTVRCSEKFSFFVFFLPVYKVVTCTVNFA